MQARGLSRNTKAKLLTSNHQLIPLQLFAISNINRNSFNYLKVLKSNQILLTFAKLYSPDISQKAEKQLVPGQKPPNWAYTHSAHQLMTLAQLLIPLAILFSVSLVFFGMSGGYYDTDAYDGNGTAH